MGSTLHCLRNVIFPTAGNDIIAPPRPDVTKGSLEKNAELAMEIATRLHDDEVRRRQSADTKAALYLAFLAAVIPVIGTLRPAISTEFRGTLIALDAVLFFLALIYILRAGWFSAKALATSRVVSISDGDLLAALRTKNARAMMASKLIEATLLNYSLNNRKITYVNLTQKHIFRAFVSILLIVSLDWGTDIVTAIHQLRQESINTSIVTTCSPIGLTKRLNAALPDIALSYHFPEPSGAGKCIPMSIAGH